MMVYDAQGRDITHIAFLDREKVRAALEEAFFESGDSEMLAECRAGWTVDLFLKALAAGGSN